MKTKIKQKVKNIVVEVLLAYIITELMFFIYKYGNYSPEYLLAPIVFLLILIYLNISKK